MGMKDVLLRELEVVSVPEDDVLRLRGVAEDLVGKLKKKGLRAVIGGSMAKGTMIRKIKFSESRDKKLEIRSEGERQDVDIFVVFDYSEDILKLGSVLEGMDLSPRDDPAGPSGVLKRVHGSRDYFHIVYDDVVLEVIPVVKNRDPELAENVMDVSLSHVKYISGAIAKDPVIADEIKLAKAFARAQRCYGAEGYVRGFSGYSLEILVIHFGSFVKFLRGMRKHRVVDPMKYFKGSVEVMRELNSSKLQGPMVVVDPTYKFRNVCAGLGLGTFERFLEVAEEFLRKPSLEFFERKEVDVKALRAFAVQGPRSKVQRRRFLELELSTDRQEGDIAGTKMKKFFSFFVRELGRAGQVVLRREFDYGGVGKEAKGYLVVLEKDVVERRGPSVGLEEQALAFKKAKVAGGRSKVEGRRSKVVGERAVFKRRGFWWVREKVSVEGVLEFVRGFGGEMGASMTLSSKGGRG